MTTETNPYENHQNSSPLVSTPQPSVSSSAFSFPFPFPFPSASDFSFPFPLPIPNHPENKPFSPSLLGLQNRTPLFVLTGDPVVSIVFPFLCFLAHLNGGVPGRPSSSVKPPLSNGAPPPSVSPITNSEGPGLPSFSYGFVTTPTGATKTESSGLSSPVCRSSRSDSVSEGVGEEPVFG